MSRASHQCRNTRRRPWTMHVTKTTVERLEDPARRVREPHPCEVPRIVAVAPAAGTADHLDWIRQETAPRPGA
ncbi:divalent cation tolerance protein CutA [Streptosporangium sp. NPDC006007]|uniref:divalent cation tolerance protein CutA n=1 Tax=Streptosporangium sp. NPDC006007 TaxID=3154575 RepID=UPI0033A15A47